MPTAAAFRGGVVRFDVRVDGSGCDPVWTAPVRSAAVPKLSLADGQLYTVRRTGPTGSPWPGLLDRFDLVTVDFATGAVRAAGRPGETALYETMQLAGNVGPGRALWQGTLFGVVRLAKSTPGGTRTRDRQIKSPLVSRSIGAIWLKRSTDAHTAHSRAGVWYRDWYRAHRSYRTTVPSEVTPSWRRLRPRPRI